MKIPLDQNKFIWQIPTAGVLYTVGYLAVPANANWRVSEGSPFQVLLPVYEETTADASGNWSITPKKFTSSNYWPVSQLAYAYDVNASSSLTFSYDSNTNTFSGTGATPSGTVRLYYIPFGVEMRVEAQFQTPEGRKIKTLWMGDSGEFIYKDLGKDKVRFEAGVDLIRSDRMFIKGRSDDSSVIISPFLPDGQTLVPILKVRLYVDQISTSVE